MNLHTRSLLAASGGGGGVGEATPITISFTGTPSTGASDIYDMGLAFTTTQALWAVSSRAYLPNSTGNLYDMRLWDSRDTSVPIANNTITGITGAWSDPVEFSAPVLLDSGVQYRIIARCHYGYHSLGLTSFTFDTALATINGGCYTSSAGSYPSSMSTSTNYGFADILVAPA